MPYYSFSVFSHNTDWIKEFDLLISLFFKKRRKLTKDNFKHSVRSEKNILSTIRIFGVFEEAIKDLLLYGLKDNDHDQKIIEYFDDYFESQAINFKSYKRLNDFIKRVRGFHYKKEDFNGVDYNNFINMMNSAFGTVAKVYGFRNNYAHKSLSTVDKTSLPSHTEIAQTIILLIFVFSVNAKSHQEKVSRKIMLETDANLQFLVDVGFIKEIS